MNINARLVRDRPNLRFGFESTDMKMCLLHLGNNTPPVMRLGAGLYILLPRTFYPAIPCNEIKITEQVRELIDEKERENYGISARTYIRKITKNPLSFYRIFPHLPALISQRRMRFRIGFQALPYGQVLLIGYTVEKNISE